MIQYDVLIGEDEDMPVGHDWLLIEHAEGVLLVMRRSTAGAPQSIAKVWAAGRHLAELRGDRYWPPLAV